MRKDAVKPRTKEAPLSTKREAKSYFDDVAGVYGGFFQDQAAAAVYPLGLRRLEMALDFIMREAGFAGSTLIDLGCGQGQLSVAAARRGMRGMAVDESPAMLKMVAVNAGALTPGETADLTMMEADALRSGLAAESADVVAALGLIEYLDEAEIPIFFDEAARLLRPGGILLVETRNRLFNMASLNSYTISEIEAGAGRQMIEEIEDNVARGLDIAAKRAFLHRLRALLPDLEAAIEADEAGTPEATDEGPSRDGLSAIKRLQHSPRTLADMASDAALVPLAALGLHPHPLPPRLERASPRFFNCLAAMFEPLAAQPASLAWSSAVFTVFKKPRP